MEKAQKIVELLNLIRVWPKRSKKCCWSNFYIFSAKVKMFINSEIFDFFMTIIVLLNTVILVLDINDEV
jgi:hypothetical protein